MDKREAFTLIELLVVIAIISLLMAILMPALNYVRKQAHSNACQSNIRQLCLAMNLYVLDHEDKTMPFSHQPGEYWFHQLAPYLSEKEYKNNPQEHIEGMMRVAFCPATKRQERDEESYYGSAYLSWRFMGGEGSYGLNLWLLPDDEIKLLQEILRRRGQCAAIRRFGLGWFVAFRSRCGAGRYHRTDRISGLSARRRILHGAILRRPAQKSNQYRIRGQPDRKGAAGRIMDTKMASELQAEFRCIHPVN